MSVRKYTANRLRDRERVLRDDLCCGLVGCEVCRRRLPAHQLTANLRPDSRCITILDAATLAYGHGLFENHACLGSDILLLRSEIESAMALPHAKRRQIRKFAQTMSSPNRRVFVVEDVNDAAMAEILSRTMLVLKSVIRSGELTPPESTNISSDEDDDADGGDMLAILNGLDISGKNATAEELKGSLPSSPLPSPPLPSSPLLTSSLLSSLRLSSLLLSCPLHSSQWLSSPPLSLLSLFPLPLSWQAAIAATRLRMQAILGASGRWRCLLLTEYVAEVLGEGAGRDAGEAAVSRKIDVAPVEDSTQQIKQELAAVYDTAALHNATSTGAAGVLGGLVGDVEADFNSEAFVPHASPVQLSAWTRQGFKPVAASNGVASRFVVRGRLDVSARDRNIAVIKVKGDTAASLKAHLNVNDHEVNVFIKGRWHINRAIHGDSVVVEILGHEDNSARVLQSVKGQGRTLYPPIVQSKTQGALRGRVVGILARTPAIIVATIPISSDAARSLEDAFVSGGTSASATSYYDVNTSNDHSTLVVPMDARLPLIRVHSRQLALLAGYRVIVDIDDWPAASAYPHGHYVRTIGRALETETEVMCVMLQTGVVDHARPFPQASLSCLPTLPPSRRWSVLWQRMCDAAATRKKYDVERLDLRWTHGVCSIDPPGCTDIDDALSVRYLSNGNVEVGVHIADVTSFVEAGSDLDREALARATTVYLVDRRLDMLPRTLSENVCSLRARVDRYAMSVLWELEVVGDLGTVEGDPVANLDFSIVQDKTWFGRTIIRSTNALTYNQAEDIILGRFAGDSVARATEEFSGPPSLSDFYCHPNCSAFSATDLDPASFSAPALERLRRDHTFYADDPPEGGLCGASVHSADIEELTPRLRLLTSVARWLKRRRQLTGALEFDSSEVRFVLASGPSGAEAVGSGPPDAEQLDFAQAAKDVDTQPVETSTGPEGGASDVQPVGVVVKRQREVNETIAELMIFANEATAKLCYLGFPLSAILRRHAPAQSADFADLLEVASSIGYTVDVTSNEKLAASLKAMIIDVEKRTNKDVSESQASVLRALTLRAMTRAEYFAASDPAVLHQPGRSGSSLRGHHVVPYAGGIYVATVMNVEAPADYGHYGLGLNLYTHFTSPIRRYADDLVHRLLYECIIGRYLQPTPTHDVRVLPSRMLPASNVQSAAEQARSIKKDTLADYLPSLLGDSSSDDDDSEEGGMGTLEDILGFSSVPKGVTPESAGVGGAERAAHADTTLYTAQQMIDMCEHINARNLSAKIAGMECDQLFLAMYFRNRVEAVEGVVSKIWKDAIQVYIRDYDFYSTIKLIREEEDRSTCSVPPKLFGFKADPLVVPQRTQDLFLNIEKSTQDVLLRSGTVSLDFPVTGIHAEEARENTITSLRVTTAAGEAKFTLLDKLPLFVTCKYDLTHARRPPLRVELRGGDVGRLDGAATASMPDSAVDCISGATIRSPTIPSFYTCMLDDGGIESHQPQKRAKGAIKRAVLPGTSNCRIRFKDFLPPPPVALHLDHFRVGGDASFADYDRSYELEESALSLAMSTIRGASEQPPTKHDAARPQASWRQGLPTTAAPRSALLSVFDDAELRGLTGSLEDGAGTASYYASRSGAGESSGFMLGSYSALQAAEREAKTRQGKLFAEKRHDRIDKEKRKEKK